MYARLIRLTCENPNVLVPRGCRSFAKVDPTGEVTEVKIPTIYIQINTLVYECVSMTLSAKSPFHLACNVRLNHVISIRSSQEAHDLFESSNR